MSLKANSSTSRPSSATLPPSASGTPAAAPQRTATPAPQRTATSTAPRDGFALSDPRAKSSTSPLLTGGSPQATRVRAVGNTSGATGTAAYRTQKELSEKRQALGKDMQELEVLKHMVQQSPILGVFHGGKMDKLGKRIDQTKQEVQRLEAVAKTQPADEVQRASFQVFNERLASLEAEVGKSKTARLARQTYYNDKSFNASAGTLPASEAELLKAGFPTSPLMKAPNGDLVDVGHVACGLDWQVNPSPMNRVGADLEQVTLTGDLGAATLAMGRGNLSAAKALNQEASVPDLNGDIDGLNLATRLRNQPHQSLADTFKAYYGNNPKNRAEEFATHSRFVQKDANGQPRKDAKGNFVLDEAKLEAAAVGFAKELLRVDYVTGSNDKGVDDATLAAKADAVVHQWKSWFDQETRRPASRPPVS